MPIDGAGYEAVATLTKELPECDEVWPKGAQIEGAVCVGNRILRKR